MHVRHLYKSDKPDFMTEEEIKQALDEMERDILINTEASQVKDPDGASHMVSFYEKHITYLQAHPKINPELYLANIRTMLRIRHS